MNKTVNQIKAIVSMLLAFLMLLVGCKPSSDITAAAKEISNISAAAGFLARCVEESEGFIASPHEGDKVSDHAYLYDNAVALIALSEAGADWHVQKIADSIVFAQAHDRKFSDGRLRNTYTSGDPKSDSGRSIIGEKITIRLPGFWKDGRWQEDGYTTSTSTGNMAWAILALCKAAETAPAEKQAEYRNAAAKAADFVLTLGSSEGGFTAGYEGWDDAQVKVTYKSTEHNIDLINAFLAIAEATAERDPKQSAEYQKASEHAKQFVLSMYDEELHCFYTGTEADGVTPSEGVLPLDTNTLVILSLHEELDDTYKILTFVEQKMAVGAGFDFSAGDLDGIWNEGTAQMAVCYNLVGATQKYDTTMKYLKTQLSREGSIPAADRDGVSTGFVVNGSETLWEFHNTLSISATSWYALAQMKVNPFAK